MIHGYAPMLEVRMAHIYGAIRQQRQRNVLAAPKHPYPTVTARLSARRFGGCCPDPARRGTGASALTDPAK